MVGLLCKKCIDKVVFFLKFLGNWLVIFCIFIGKFSINFFLVYWLFGKIWIDKKIWIKEIMCFFSNDSFFSFVGIWLLLRLLSLVFNGYILFCFILLW